jgi:putative restriction endonuclease
MQRTELLAAIERYKGGERPYKFVSPNWHLLGEDGAAYPLKYVYAMAIELDPLRTHTDAAKLAAIGAGFEIINVSKISAQSIIGTSFWWVNHKQTHRAEYAGGYIWSPKTKRDSSANEGYLNLTRVRVGDQIFSYADGAIKAIGIATQAHTEAPIPPTHIDAADWDNFGWQVTVEWIPLAVSLRPKDFLDQIVPLLPAKHAPIRATGDGNQGCYLASISKDLGELLLSLLSQVDPDAAELLHEIEVEAGDALEAELLQSADIPETEKVQLVRSRVGQGIFRMRVVKQEKKCRLTGVDNLAFLVASHIKPWRVSTNEERLSGSNGLLLSPHVDKLFDRGWISFSDKGEILIAKEVVAVAKAWGIDANITVGEFNLKQRVFLKYHRHKIYKG